MVANTLHTVCGNPTPHEIHRGTIRAHHAKPDTTPDDTPSHCVRVAHRADDAHLPDGSRWDACVSCGRLQIQKAARTSVGTAIPCALIINELVSKSIKYAFPGGRKGDVTVALERANGAYTLTVADEGVGFRADLDFRATDSLGMQLVVMLVKQLAGIIELNRENGTAFVISFHLD
jgi:anti-sigma regulatory factor (Ser/Thr protein kinase)